MQKRNVIAVLLVICTLVTLPQTAVKVWATSAQQQKEDAENKLEDVKDEIDDITDKQNQTADKIKDTKKQLSALMEQQTELEGDIAQNTAQLTITQQELEAAKKDEQEQYEAMKLRIQFMYENSTQDSFWEAIIGSNGITDMLNRLEYVLAVHKSDRELTEEYQQTVALVEEKKTQLLTEQEELLYQQEVYIGRQSEIESMIASLEEDQEEFSEMLASAQAQAKKYEEEIRIQEEIIKKQQEEALASKGDPNATAADIIAYARKFVGNPYVWGGNSLTEGCDCSGFVHLVFKHFGYSLPRYSMSFLNVGKKVTLDEIQPGDIVIYNKLNGIGHVAIYIGDGKIVEAQSSAAGITDTRKVDCRSIAGIRRVIGVNN